MKETRKECKILIWIPQRMTQHGRSMVPHKLSYNVWVGLSWLKIWLMECFIKMVMDLLVGCQCIISRSAE